MKCCAEGCNREAKYKALQLCQIHYHQSRPKVPYVPVARGGIDQMWAEACQAAREARAQKQRCLDAMRRAAYREDAC